MKFFLVIRVAFLPIFIWNLQNFVRCSKDQKENKLHLSLLNVLTENDSKFRYNDRSQYVVENYGLSYQLTFENNSNCTEVKYDGKTVWKKDGSQESLRALCIHLDLGQIFLQIGGFAYLYNYKNNKLNLESVKPLNELTDEGIEILTSNQNEDYKVSDYSYSRYYDFNSDATCTEVKFKDATLWKYGGETNHQFPKRLYFNFFKKIMIADFDGFYLVLNYRKTGSNLLSKTEVNQVPDSMLTVVTNDGSGNKENDHGKYQLRRYDLISEYLFTDEANCTQVKYGNKNLWKDDSNSKSDYPKALCLHKDLGLLFLQFNNSVNSYKCNESNCVLLTKFPLNGFKQSKLSIITEDNQSISSVNDPSQMEEKSFGFGTEFVFNPGTKCTIVRYGDDEVWNNDCQESENKFPNKLFLHLYTKMLIVDFNEFYLVYQHDGKRFNLLCKDSLSGLSDNDFRFMNGSEYLGMKDYSITKYPYGYADVFQFKEGINCTEVKFNNATVWKAEPGSPEPKLVYTNWDMKMMLLESPAFMNAYMYINKAWTQVFKYPDEKQSKEESDDSVVEVSDDDSEGTDDKKLEEKVDESDNKSSLRGNESKGKERSKTMPPLKSDKKTLVLVIGSVVSCFLLLCLALLVFYYLK